MLQAADEDTVVGLRLRGHNSYGASCFCHQVCWDDISSRLHSLLRRLSGAGAPKYQYLQGGHRTLSLRGVSLEILLKN